MHDSDPLLCDAHKTGSSTEDETAPLGRSENFKTLVWPINPHGIYEATKAIIQNFSANIFVRILLSGKANSFCYLPM